MGRKEPFPYLSMESREKRLLEVEAKRREIIDEGERGQGIFTTWYALPSDPGYKDEVPLGHLLFTASLSRKYDDIFYLYALETYDWEAHHKAYEQAKLEARHDENIDIDRRSLELLKAGVEITPFFARQKVRKDRIGTTPLIEVVGVVDVYNFDSDGVVRAINMFLDLGETDYQGEPLVHRASEGFIRMLEEELSEGEGRLVIATRETLEAVKRLKAGPGLRMSLADFRQRLLEVFPAYKEQLLKKYADEKKILENGGIGPDLFKRKSIVLDLDFPRKLGALQKLDFTFEELDGCLNCLTVLALGGIVRREWENANPDNQNHYREHENPDDHSLQNQGTDDLKGFKSFCVRFAPEPEKRIICLYSVEKGILRLASIGEHNYVYRRVEPGSLKG